MTNADRPAPVLVFETRIQLDREDGGQALITGYAGNDPHCHVRLISWDEAKVHPSLEPLLTKRLRITVDVIEED